MPRINKNYDIEANDKDLRIIVARQKRLADVAKGYALWIPADEDLTEDVINDIEANGVILRNDLLKLGDRVTINVKEYPEDRTVDSHIEFSSSKYGSLKDQKGDVEGKKPKSTRYVCFDLNCAEDTNEDCPLGAFPFCNRHGELICKKRG